MIAWIAVVISIAALVVAILSWRESVQATRAAIYDRRYEVYADAEKFLSTWMRKGDPDIEELNILIGAWSRSQFLFSDKVATYLRKLWTDAVKADYAKKVLSREYDGDRNEASEISHELRLEHAVSYEKLREVFEDELKVKS